MSEVKSTSDTMQNLVAAHGAPAMEGLWACHDLEESELLAAFKILKAYKAEMMDDSKPFHGRVAGKPSVKQAWARGEKPCAKAYFLFHDMKFFLGMVAGNPAIIVDVPADKYSSAPIVCALNATLINAFEEIDATPETRMHNLGVFAEDPTRRTLAVSVVLYEPTPQSVDFVRSVLRIAMFLMSITEAKELSDEDRSYDNGVKHDDADDDAETDDGR